MLTRHTMNVYKYKCLSQSHTIYTTILFRSLHLIHIFIKLLFCFMIRQKCHLKVDTQVDDGIRIVQIHHRRARKGLRPRLWS
jgi:predicted ferric reductase